MIDPETNRMKLEIARSILPTERDAENFVHYLIGILMNYVDEDTWAYCIGQAFKCWSELHPEELRFTRERVVLQ